MTIFKIINSLMKAHVPLIILSLVTGLLTVISSIGMLSTSSVLISKAALHPDVLDLMVLIVAVRFFGISRGVFRYLERLLSHDTTFKILSSLRKWFYKSFNEGYSENHKQFKTGDIYTKLINDIDCLRELFLRGIYPLIIAILTGIFTALFLNCFNAYLFYTYLLFYIFSGFILPFILYKSKDKLVEKESRLKEEINKLLLDTLEGALEIYTYSLQEKQTEKYTNLYNELSKIQKRKNAILILGESISNLCISMLVGLTLFETAPLIKNGSLPGVYFAMFPLAIMASFEALVPMPNILYKFDEAFNSGKNILSIINSDIPHIDSRQSPSGNYNLSIKNMSIFDTDSSRYIVEDISFELPEGKKLAIVGLSGSGKSTILKTLLGFIKPDTGIIEIGGISYKNLDTDELRKLFTYVEQSPYWFNTTIDENLRISNTEVEKSVLEDSLTKFHVFDFVNKLPKGLNTLVGKNGSNFSGGEKQRLAISRSFLKDCPIVLLDEPTAGLDIELERKVINSIHESIHNKSCIWVTHRLINMDKMDEIIVIDNGQILEQGTHKELLATNGLYFKLWSTQQKFIKSI